MLNLLGTEIGIENPRFYLPAQRYPLLEYLHDKSQDFTFQRMKSVWQEGFFEAEFFYRFLTEQISTWNQRAWTLADDEVDRFVRESGIEYVYQAADEMSSEMAALVARKVLDGSGYQARAVKAVIYYHATLNQDPFKSIACQLQHELGLNNAFVSSLSQSGGNASLLAIKVASELLMAEPETGLVLLVGSEKLVSPYQRLFGGITAIGDSASGMLVKRESASLRVLAIHARDVPEWWRFDNRLEVESRDINEDLASLSAALIAETMDELCLVWNDVAMVLPSNLSLAFAKRLIDKAQIPDGKLWINNIGRFGHLLTSDLVVNLATVMEEGHLKRHDLILVLNLGFSLSLGCMALRV